MAEPDPNAPLSPDTATPVADGGPPPDDERGGAHIPVAAIGDDEAELAATREAAGSDPAEAAADAIGRDRPASSAPAGQGAALAGDRPELPSGSRGAASPPAPPRRSGAVLAGLLLGLLLAGLGVAGGWFLWRPGGPLARPAGPDPAALSARLDQIEARAAGHAPAEALTALQAAQDALSRRLDTAEATGAELRQALAEQGERLAELARRPPVGDPEAAAAFERELASIRAMVADEVAAMKTQAAALATTQAEAEASGRQARAAAAVAQIGAALESGAGFEAALRELAEARPEADLAALRPLAQGVPTLAALRESFPDAARAALAAARSQGGESGTAAFLRAQLGLRSLAPREGADADAILSRAEAALGRGDLAAALAGLAALPPEALPALARWQGDAERRLAALAAVAGLTAALPASPTPAPADEERP